MGPQRIWGGNDYAEVRLANVLSPHFLQMNRRGQASILIAIIFQVLFIFFAMVINVGMLVHDKINLQNSVDIAAYYGAMKQAEVLNVMGHVNYQIRSTYKLFNFRLWSLGNAGRSGWRFGPDKTDHLAKWISDDKTAFPIVCVAHDFWFEGDQKKTGNLCKLPSIYVPKIQPIDLTGFQPAFAGFLQVFANQSAANNSLFVADFSKSGIASYALAMKFLASYKISAAKKRAAMQSLQKLLTGVGQGSRPPPCQVTGNDFCDVSGSSVKNTVETTIRKNLTAANLRGLGDIEFANPLFGRPFLVPVEVRTFVKYEDLSGAGAAATGSPQDVTQPPREGLPAGVTQALSEQFFGPDYEGKYPPASAQEFAGENEPNHNLNSLIGFEKDPWTLAYVRVAAQTTPKMLFSPFLSSDNKGIVLKAEAYAMPFGGRIGPWYADGWPAGASSSNSSTKLDNLLPPRYPETFGSYDIPPNFSRYPGDSLGMQSAMAENVAIPFWDTEKPHFSGDNYEGLDMNPDNATQDEIVEDQARGDGSAVRRVEIAAIAPNLFDAVYFSVEGQFDNFYHQNVFGGNVLFSQICEERCNDLATRLSPANSSVSSVVDHVTVGARTFPEEWWLVKDPGLLNASWTQEATDDYVRGPTKVGLKKVEGGRTGYSVKIVSKEFLNRGNLPFGGSAGPGALKNNPSSALGE